MPVWYGVDYQRVTAVLAARGCPFSDIGCPVCRVGAAICRANLTVQRTSMTRYTKILNFIGRHG